MAAKEHVVIVRTLKILGWVTGVSLMVLGAGRIFFPLETIPGAGAVTATMDSETRAPISTLSASASTTFVISRNPSSMSTRATA